MDWLGPSAACAHSTTLEPPSAQCWLGREWNRLNITHHLALIFWVCDLRIVLLFFFTCCFRLLGHVAGCSFLTIAGKFSVRIGSLLYVFGSCERQSTPTKETYIPFRQIPKRNALCCHVHSKPTKEMYITLRPIPKRNALCYHVHSKPTKETYIPFRQIPKRDTLCCRLYKLGN